MTAEGAGWGRRPAGPGHFSVVASLNLENLPPLLAAAPHVAEASIGHELTADALTMGWKSAILAYRAALAGAKGED